MIMVGIDENHVEIGAELWWKSLTPRQRGVYLQALWEGEREPAPELRKKDKAKEEDTQL